ncbi:valacyclovir hydrolase-like [Montipora capricornis]|uniref:valacyclovir hydrolase-like n=1 Tax=Montipora capricornis TaxID=246305 RepID=UPI0035F1329B
MAAILSRLAEVLSKTTKYPCLQTRRGIRALSSKIEVNGVKIHHEVAGQGSRVVLCMSGALGSTQSDFAPQLNGLSAEFTVVAFDPRGYGKSIPPKRDFPTGFFERDADDAAGLMNALGLSKYSLLGWSDGGITSLILTSKYPHCIDSMVVWGANATVTEQDIELYEKIRDTSKWNPKMREPLEALYGKEGLQEIQSGWIAGISKYYTDRGGDICTKAVKSITCPTLVVHGQKDPLVPQFHPEYLHNNIPGSKLHIMPQGKHNLHLRFADEFNLLVKKFLNGQF